jgi:hypothetical protein
MDPFGARVDRVERFQFGSGEEHVRHGFDSLLRCALGRVDAVRSAIARVAT